MITDSTEKKIPNFLYSLKKERKDIALASKNSEMQRYD